MKNPVSIFGIRHHGPGSTKSLLTALSDLEPDCLLIEGPPDANDAIEYLANPDLVPPVALLVYNPSNLKQAAYFPFAHFSPEWQAMKYGLEKEIQVEFMDLPRTYSFTLDKTEDDKHQQLIDFQNPLDTAVEEGGQIYKDPFGEIAKLAGYEDSERWWEITFERQENPRAIFDAVLDLMKELRSAAKPTTYRELQREAYMRKVIRAAVKKGYENIAVVCGAWHAPVLAQWQTYKSTQDNKFLKGVKKSKSKATWVPWTYKRLARQSGYAAGVVSPAWYELLYDKPEEVVIQWMSKVAALLRKEDLDASSAHVIEAVRLATSLATIRLLAVPGINELSEAAISIFCAGNPARLELIQKILIVGDRMGEVPSTIPVIPLQQDLMKCIKSARLTKDQRAFEKVEKSLDLRTPSNLAASHLLHRLNILEIPWGQALEASAHRLGNFKEEWLLEWLPDFAIRIIEAGMWGNTVYEAATNFILSSGKKQENLAQLTRLIEQALKADLQKVILELTTRLSDLSAITKDIFNLMDALPSLVNIVRYGSARQFSTAAVQAVIAHIVPRICIGLPSSCLQIDEAATKQTFQRIVGVNLALHTLNEAKYIRQWYLTIGQIMNSQVNGMLSGVCTRILFDKQHIAPEITNTKMLLALSKGNASMYSAKWIAGFLNGSGLLLIYNEALWEILDDWVSKLPEERFMEILPILRRTFSEFSPPERQKMLDLAKQTKKRVKKGKDWKSTINEERAKKVMPTLELVLGLNRQLPK